MPNEQAETRREEKVYHVGVLERGLGHRSFAVLKNGELISPSETEALVMVEALNSGSAVAALEQRVEELEAENAQWKVEHEKVTQELAAILDAYDAAFKSVPDYAEGDSLPECFRSLDRRIQSLQTAHAAVVEALDKIHRWLVCAAIATPEDMAQSFEEMEATASAALEKAKECGG